MTLKAFGASTLPSTPETWLKTPVFRSESLYLSLIFGQVQGFFIFEGNLVVITLILPRAAT